MLRNCVSVARAHVLDATPVMGWGGVGMLTFAEVNNGGIMNDIRTGRNVRLYSDGARCWPAMRKAHGIRNFHVKHNKFEFAKKLPDVKRPKRSRCRYTMRRPHVGFFGQIHSA